ncbi:MAG: hypothetical protein LBG59_08090 [Candidatus Peribacteria bacterium]|nr:hypothetical protein [Candidatus Peribacteria bacterium]
MTCKSSDGTTVADGYCSGTKPATSQSCSTSLCGTSSYPTSQSCTNTTSCG